MKIEFEPIGYVKNEVDEKKDTAWGSDVSKIVIKPDLAEGLSGLADFTHIIVVTYLHEAKFEAEQHLVRRPQGREDMPLVGIFSQRAKDRPNPIGITSTELLGVSNNVVMVKGLDAINGTPVLDIKPYYPMYDKKDSARVPEWVELLMEDYF